MTGEIKITFNREPQGCGRNTELIHKEQIRVAEQVLHNMAMHCELLCDLACRQAPKAHTSDSHARTYIGKCAREECE